ncbi:MAG: radical SAM protein [Lachnospiraceae bacterium]|nr:radical SAM protein [Lachnospiraceae bacterium]
MNELIMQLNFPFCFKHCSFCPQSVCKYSPQMMRTYTEAMVREIQSAAADMDDCEVTAVSIEGGSPVLAEPSGLQKVLRALRKNFHLAEDVQISLQTMPGDYSRALMQKLPDCGVNHWIFGVQTADLNEHLLLERPYSYEALSMVDVALKTFDVHNRSFELLYGIPGQTEHTWEHSLLSVLSYEPEHLTLYPLHLCRGTSLYRRWQEEHLTVCTAQEKTAFYQQAKTRLAELGYRQYTIYDFAKPGCENQFRVRELNGTERLGIGYKAESYLDGVSYKNGHSLQQYLDHSDDLSVIANQVARLDDESLMYKEMHSALISLAGIDLSVLREKYGEVLAEKAREALQQMEMKNDICQHEGKWLLTDTGVTEFT